MKSKIPKLFRNNGMWHRHSHVQGLFICMIDFTFGVCWANVTFLLLSFSSVLDSKTDDKLSHKRLGVTDFSEMSVGGGYSMVRKPLCALSM